MTDHAQNYAPKRPAPETGRRVVNLVFETYDFETWAAWFDSAARALGLSGYRVYRDLEDRACVDVFFTVDTERHGTELGQALVRQSEDESAVVSARFVAAFRKG